MALSIPTTNGMKSSEFILVILYMTALIFQVRLGLTVDMLTQAQWVLMTYIGSRGVVKAFSAAKK